MPIVDTEDPIIRRFCQLALVLLVICFICIGFLSSWVVFDWDGHGNHSALLVKIITSIPDISGVKKATGSDNSGDIKTIFAIFISSIPMLFASVCFTTADDKKRVNLFGGIILGGLFIAVLLELIGYSSISLSWQDGHELGPDGLNKIIMLAKGALTASVFYVSSLLGLKAQS